MRLSWQAWRSLQSWSSTCQPESVDGKQQHVMEVAAVESCRVISWRSHLVFPTLSATPMCVILGHLGESVVRSCYSCTMAMSVCVSAV